MIPISKDSVMDYLDPDSGITFHFRPLLGDAEYAYYSAIGSLSSNVDHTPFIGEAEKQVDAENPAKVWDKDEKEKAVRKRAMTIAAVRKERTPEETVKETIREGDALGGIIDAVLLGWEGPGAIPFPAEKPSASLRLSDKRKMFKVIMDLNGELTEAEEKN